MSSSAPVPLASLLGAPTSIPAPLRMETVPGGHALPVEFTGSGSEYFRIWIVNLLLIALTLGLYFPWAKVRRLRYFYGNTLIGEHGLDFHGEPRRMLRGFLLAGALLGLYSLAGQVSAGAGLVALVIVAAVWPALFRAAQQFRLANTSWRGLRFRFSGDLPGAYRAMIPFFAPGLALLALLLWAGDDPASRRAAAMPALAISLAALLLFPALWWLLKKYQHDHYVLGQVRTELRAGAPAFYAVFAKAIGVSLLAAFAGGVLVALIAGGSAFALLGGPGRSQGVAAWVVAGLFAMLATYAAAALVIRPYLTARLQNLVWTRTKSSQVRFVSRLRFWPLVGLTLKNWLLVLLTLGLYWPFAAIATARMRLQAVTLYTRLSPDELVTRQRESARDAAGDAAGDLFGIDIGL